MLSIDIGRINFAFAILLDHDLIVGLLNLNDFTIRCSDPFPEFEIEANSSIVIERALVLKKFMDIVFDKYNINTVIIEKQSNNNIFAMSVQSMLVGISQAIAAAFPGVSRSGITMTVARALKIDRESAAKFSFLLSTPIVAAAVLVDVGKFALTSMSFWIGVIASFIVGLIVIKFLMNYLKKGSFKIFAIYRVILGLIILGLIFVR